MQVTSGTFAALFLNKNAIDSTIDQNVFVASATSSQTVFLDGPDLFHGLYFTNNNVLRNGALGGTGLFVDGNRNIGSSVAQTPLSPRSPLIQGNLFQNHALGLNAGIRSFENAQFVENTFTGNLGGFAGGPKNSLIARNTFTTNEYYGLRLTGFGSGLTDPARGAEGNTVENNVFSGNGWTVLGTGYGDLRLDNQADGLQSTNVIRNNSFGSMVALYVNETSGETYQLSGNWWGTNANPEFTPNKILGGGSRHGRLQPLARPAHRYVRHHGLPG